MRNFRNKRDINKIRLENKLSNKKKTDQLGMPYGTAGGRLRKLILFYLLQKYNENICFQCNKEIETVEELSIEHKKPWLDIDPKLFWNIDNIAFSHLKCNIKFKRQRQKIHVHGTATCYGYGCRCNLCRHAGTIERRKHKRNYIKKNQTIG